MQNSFPSHQQSAVTELWTVPADNGEILARQEELQRILLDRYEKARILGLTRSLRFHYRRLLWLVVISSTYLVKRLFDMMVAGIMLLLFLPLALLVALLIRLDSPGPALFCQVRVGRWGRLFPMWKFRTMYVDAEQRLMALHNHNEMSDGVLFKMRKDPRITRVGRFLRRSSIDELPQLWNVVVGDMSLVGPRPALPHEVNRYSLEDRRRLEVIPGITCLWQISGRSELPFPKQVKLDVQYIESHSLWQDIKILLKTIPAVFLGRGAY